MRNLFILTFASVLMVSCDQEEPVQQTAAPAQQPAQGHPGPMNTTATTSLDYELPAEWTRTQPASPMRLDQATIPGEAGPGELAVFFFGPGGGGGTEANLQRWIGQITTSAEPIRDSFDTDGLKITWIDATGTINPSTMGMGPSEPQPNSRMFAAVVEGEGGPWFFKATGPEQTMADARDEFLEMLRNLSISSSAPAV